MYRHETLTVDQARARLDELAPEHDRTSCADDNLANARPNSERTFRCVRCTLLSRAPGAEIRLALAVSAVDPDAAARAARRRELETELESLR